MIYIEPTTDLQDILIPDVYGYESGGSAVQLVLLSTVDLEKLAMQQAAADGDYSGATFSEAFRVGEPLAITVSADKRYLTMSVKFDVAPVIGSWEYRLAQGSRVIASGVAQVGDYEAEDTSYEKPIQYEQY